MIFILVLITYDVSTSSKGGVKRLRHVAKKCEIYGQRVQNSVFECILDNSQLINLRHELIQIIDEDKDSLRIYRIGKNYQSKIEHIGSKETINLDDVLIL